MLLRIKLLGVLPTPSLVLYFSIHFNVFIFIFIFGETEHTCGWIKEANKNMTSNIKDYVLQTLTIFFFLWETTLTNLLRVYVVVSFSIASNSSTWQNCLQSILFIYLFLCWVDFLFLFFALTYTTFAYDMCFDCIRK